MLSETNKIQSSGNDLKTYEIERLQMIPKANKGGISERLVEDSCQVLGLDKNKL